MRRKIMFFRRFVFVLFAVMATNVFAACEIDYTVNLNTSGEGVMVELRRGRPGNSMVVRSVNSRGGKVYFSSLCPGSYFLAIGNGESVSVTPVNSFEDGASYTSTITLTYGSGNVSTRSRKDL
jgi:hypothetical protein